MIPLQKLSSQPIVNEYLPPDELFDYCHATVDYERGGVALNDPSQGFDVHTWRLRVLNNSIIIDVPEDSFIEEVVLIVGTGIITEVSLAFDQNMAPTVSYVEGGVGKLYWYDSLIPGQVTTPLGAGVISPRCFIDDKRVRQTGSSDILVFYLRGGSLYFLAQRDRFSVEYHLRDTEAIAIARQGMHKGLRVQIELVYSVLHNVSSACGFSNVVDALPNTLTASNIIQLNGFVQLDAEFMIDGGEYRIKLNQFAEWGPWTSEPSPGQAGMYIQLRTTSSPVFLATVTVTMKLGTITCLWQVTTRGAWDCTAQFSGVECYGSEGCLQFTGEDC